MASKTSPKRTAEAAGLDIVHQRWPTRERPNSVSSSSPIFDDAHSTPISSRSSTPLSPAATPSSMNTSTQECNTQHIPTSIDATKKRKLTFAEKEVKRVEKQCKEQQKAEDRARKEEEKRSKEEARRAREEETREERRRKEEEKEQKRKIKEAEKQLKEEERRRKEAEKKAREDEKAKKDKVGRIHHWIIRMRSESVTVPTKVRIVLFQACYTVWKLDFTGSKWTVESAEFYCIPKRPRCTNLYLY